MREKRKFMKIWKKLLIQILCISLLAGENAIPALAQGPDENMQSNVTITELTDMIEEDTGNLELETGTEADNEPEPEELTTEQEELTTIPEESTAQPEETTTENEVVETTSEESISDNSVSSNSISGNSISANQIYGNKNGTFEGTLDLLTDGTKGMEMFQPRVVSGQNTISGDNTTQSFSVTNTDNLLYSQIVDAMKEGETSLDIANYQMTADEDTVHELQILVQSAINNTPSFFYYDSNWEYDCNKGQIDEITWNYREEYLDGYGNPDSEVIAQAVSSYEQGVKIMMSDIKTGMTTLEKILAIHEKMVEEVDYDMANYSKGSIPYDDYSAYGVFANRVAVCNGYALAFTELMRKIGVSCYTVSSSACNHAWNLVKIGGNWFHVDVTWDDPYSYGSTNYNTIHRHTYFLCSDSEMMADHKRDWYDSGSYPRAYSSEYAGYLFRDYEYGNMSYIDGKWYVYADGRQFVSAKINGQGLTTTSLSQPYSNYGSSWWSGIFIDNYLYTFDDEKIYRHDLSGKYVDTPFEAAEGDDIEIYGLTVKSNKLCYCYSLTQDSKEKYYRKQVPILIKSLAFSKQNVVLYEANATCMNLPTASPVNHTDTITYSSSDTGVATVDSAGTVTAKANGQTTITATTSNGITASYTVTVQIAEKTTVSLTTGLLSEGAGSYADLTWTQTNFTDYYYIYRSSSVKSMELIKKIPASGTTFQYRDEVTAGDHYTYYIQTYQEIDDKLYKGSVSLPAEANLIYASSMEFTNKQETIQVGESFLVKAETVPEDTGFTYSIRYRTEDTELVTVNAQTGECRANQAGEAEIIAEAFQDSNLILTTTEKVSIKNMVDEQSRVTEDLYIVAGLNKTLGEIALPASIREDYEWQYPTAKLDIYTGGSASFSCIRRENTKENDTEYAPINVKIHFAQFTGFSTVWKRSDSVVQTPQLYLDSCLSDNEEYAAFAGIDLAVTPNILGTIPQDDGMSYQYTFAETTRLGLTLSERQSTDKNALCHISVDEHTKKGTATIKITAKAINTRTGKTVKSFSQSLKIVILQTKSGVILYQEDGLSVLDIAELEETISRLSIGDKLIIAARVDDENGNNTGVKFASQDTTVLRATPLKTDANKAELTVTGYGSTTLNITAKKNSKNIPAVSVPCNIKDYTPKISTEALTIDKNKTTGTAFSIYASYGRTVAPMSVQIQRITFKKRDVTEDLANLFVVEPTIDGYALRMTDDSSCKEQLDVLKKGDYIFTISGKWIIQEEGDILNPNQLTQAQTIGNLKVKITETKPSITGKQIRKMNLFYTNLNEEGYFTEVHDASTGVLDIRSNTEIINSIDFITPQLTCATNVEYPANTIRTSVKVNSGVHKKSIPKKVECIISCDGYRSLTYFFSIAAETKKPSVSYAKTKVTMNSYEYYNQNGVILMTLANTNSSEEMLSLPLTDIVPYNTSAKKVQNANPLQFTWISTQTGGELRITMNAEMTAGSYQYKITPIVNITDDEPQKLPAKIITVKIEKKKPVIKLEKKYLALNPYIYDTDMASEGVTLSGMNQEQLSSISFVPDNTNAKKADSCLTLSFDKTSGSIRADIVSLRDETGKTVIKNGDYVYKLTPTIERTINGQNVPDTLSTVKLVVKVKNATPKISYNTKTVTLNSSLYQYEKASIQTACTGVEGTAISNFWITPTGNSAVKNKNSFVFNYSPVNKCFSVSLKQEVPKGQYTFKLAPVIGRFYNGTTVYETYAATTIKVNVVKQTPSIKITTKGTPDLLLRETSFVQCIPKLTNKTGTYTAVRLSGVDASKFTIESMNSTNGYVKLKISENADVRASAKYSLTLTYTVHTDKGDYSITSAPFTVKPKQSTPRFTLSKNSSKLYFYQSCQPEMTQTITMKVKSPVGAKIKDITLNHSAFAIDSYEIPADSNGSSIATVIIKLTDASKVKAGKTYPLTLKVNMEGAGIGSKCMNITVKAGVRK